MNKKTESAKRAIKEIPPAYLRTMKNLDDNIKKRARITPEKQ
jgi:hypothetical protein